MLSNETAVGDYPVEAVETIATIARRIERDYPLKAIESHLFQLMYLRFELLNLLDLGFPSPERFA